MNLFNIVLVVEAHKWERPPLVVVLTLRAQEHSVIALQHSSILTKNRMYIHYSFSWAWLFESTPNFLDAFLVFSTGIIVTWILQPAGVPVGELRKFTLLRVLRLYRLALAVREDPRYRDMWILVSGVIGSAGAMLWSVVVQSFMIFVFAVTATQFLARGMETNEHVQSYFGTVGRTCAELFRDNRTNMCRAISGRHVQGYFGTVGRTCAGLFWDGRDERTCAGGR